MAITTQPLYRQVSSTYRYQLPTTAKTTPARTAVAPKPYTPVSTTYHPITNPTALPQYQAPATKVQAPAGTFRPVVNQQLPPAAAANPRVPLPDLTNLSYTSDPVLQDVIAGGNAQLTAARARKLEQQKQLLLGFGSQEMARKLLGNDPFVDTVNADPYTGTSMLAQSRRAEIDDTRAANENLNQQNLFFSSTRGQELANIVRQRILREQQYENDLQTALGNIGDQYANTEAGILSDRRSAEQQAYDRAVQNAMNKWWNATNDANAKDAADAAARAAAGGGSSSAAGPSPTVSQITPALLQGAGLAPDISNMVIDKSGFNITPPPSTTYYEPAPTVTVPSGLGYYPPPPEPVPQVVLPTGYSGVPITNQLLSSLSPTVANLLRAKGW